MMIVSVITACCVDPKEKPYLCGIAIDSIQYNGLYSF